MSEILIQTAGVYCTRHQLHLAERLGFGVHGIVHVVEGNHKPGKAAIKIHYDAEPYFRERAVYERLREAGVDALLGFHVPQLVRCDDELRVIEMTIVTRPFVLDFAGAYLGAPPHFSEEIWAEWEAQKREQFGNRWSQVQALLASLEELDIHMVDVSPSNVAYLD